MKFPQWMDLRKDAMAPGQIFDPDSYWGVLRFLFVVISIHIFIWLLVDGTNNERGGSLAKEGFKMALVNFGIGAGFQTASDLLLKPEMTWTDRIKSSAITGGVTVVAGPLAQGNIVTTSLVVGMGAGAVELAGGGENPLERYMIGVGAGGLGYVANRIVVSATLWKHPEFKGTPIDPSIPVLLQRPPVPPSPIPAERGKVAETVVQNSFSTVVDWLRKDK